VGCSVVVKQRLIKRLAVESELAEIRAAAAMAGVISDFFDGRDAAFAAWRVSVVAPCTVCSHVLASCIREWVLILWLLRLFTNFFMAWFLTFVK